MSLAIVGVGVSFAKGLACGTVACGPYAFVDRRPSARLVRSPRRCDVNIFDHETFHKSEKILIDAVAAMEKLKYNVFADSELYASSQLPSPALPVSAAEHQVGDKRHDAIPACEPQPMVLIAGWAVDWPAGELAGGVTVVLDGVEHPARYGLPSDEAVKALGSNKFSHAGFLCAVPASELGSGRHTIFLKVLTRDRTAVFKGPPSTFNVGVFSESKP